MGLDDHKLVPLAAHEVTLQRDPKQVLEQAKEAATELMKVVNAKPNPVIFNNERYLDVQDWQTLGRMYGLTAKIVSTEPIEFDGAVGFLARAIAIRADGHEVSAAEAMCMNDEDNWSTRPKYEWHYVTKSGKVQKEDPGADQIVWEKKKGKNLPKKKRVHIGDVKVPSFQLRSMAQTRAIGKALRHVLGYVAVLAGYNPTPAEEMTGDEAASGSGDGSALPPPPVQEPQATSNGEAPRWKEMNARFDSSCHHCNQEIKKDSPILSGNGKSIHPACQKEFEEGEGK